MRPIHIERGKVLIDGGLSDTSVTVEGSTIAAFGDPCPHGALIIDASDLLVLPGIIDIHGDAFERQIMPRPGVQFSHVLALLDTDRQLAAAGITTAYHGLTLSWEPGLRSVDAAANFLQVLKKECSRHHCLPLIKPDDMDVSETIMEAIFSRMLTKLEERITELKRLDGQEQDDPIVSKGRVSALTPIVTLPLSITLFQTSFVHSAATAAIECATIAITATVHRSRFMLFSIVEFFLASLLVEFQCRLWRSSWHCTA